MTGARGPRWRGPPVASSTGRPRAAAMVVQVVDQGQPSGGRGAGGRPWCRSCRRYSTVSRKLRSVRDGEAARRTLRGPWALSPWSPGVDVEHVGTHPGGDLGLVFELADRGLDLGPRRVQHDELVRMETGPQVRGPGERPRRRRNRRTISSAAGSSSIVYPCCGWVLSGRIWLMDPEAADPVPGAELECRPESLGVGQADPARAVPGPRPAAAGPWPWRSWWRT